MAYYKDGYCNGISAASSREHSFLLDLEERSIALKYKAKDYIKTLKDDNYLFGERFNDPANIVARAASNCHPFHDSTSRDNFVMAAFIDAASADWYYNNEKNY